MTNTEFIAYLKKEYENMKMNNPVVDIKDNILDIETEFIKTQKEYDDYFCDNEEYSSNMNEDDPNINYSSSETNNFDPLFRMEKRKRHLSDNNMISDNKRVLYQQIKEARVHPRTFYAAHVYNQMKTRRDITDVELQIALANLFGSGPRAYYFMQYRRMRAKSSIGCDEDGHRFIKLKRYNATNKLYASDQLPLSRFCSSHLRIEYNKIDPDHMMLCLNNTSLISVHYLATSRIYYELRCKARIATAILLNYKPDTSCKVNHWDNDRIYFEYKVSGLLLEKDKGVAIVSYFSDHALIRTEKWRLADVENYSVNHHRLVALVVNINTVKNLKYQKDLLDFYAAMLLENSWGTSLFYKPYRYLTYGILSNSPEIKKCELKVIESINASFQSKLSSRLLAKRIIDSDTKRGKTLAFSLPPELMAYEIFFVNLCPTQIYGRNKHLSDVMDELIGEIQSYNKAFDKIKILYDKFEDLMSSNNLDRSYEEYFELIDILVADIDGRFTGSPLSIILIYNELAKTKLIPEEMQSSCPHLSELLTARASYDPIEMNTSFAANTISSLSKDYEIESTSMLALSLLHTKMPLDLSMRMFDKDQVGGNREISILSNIFRVLQVVCESFFVGLSKFSSNEMLNRSDKIDVMMNRLSKSYQTKNRYFASIDQTRWGPNFNTSLFGLMSLCFTDMTTEAYIPSLICFLGEFKIFENPPWLLHNVEKCDSVYSLPGFVGRSHMGQGIYHNASSIYHSYVTNSIMNIYFEIAKEMVDFIDLNILCNYSSLITSDDCTIMVSVHNPDPAMRKIGNETIDEFDLRMEAIGGNIINVYKELFNSYCYIISYFGIKTSKYKNIFSSDYCEFNSVYVQPECIPQPDIKFIYSLIEPLTTGNFLQDYSNCLQSYYNAISSGCSEPTGYVIAHSNFLRFCRQWNLKANEVGLPSRRTIRVGLLPSLSKSDIPIDCMLKFRTQSFLHHKTRKILEGVRSTNLSGVGKRMLDLRLSVIDGSRAQDTHRACITHYKGPRYIITDSDYYKSYRADGETFRSLIYNLNMDCNYVNLAVNEEIETTYVYSSDLFSLPKDNRFVKIIVKDSKNDINTMEQVLVSLYDKVITCDPGSSWENIILHMLRDNWIGEIQNKYLLDECKGLSIDKKITVISDILRTLYLSVGKCSKYIHRKSRENITYRRIIIDPPVKETLISYSLQTYKDHKVPSLRGNISTIGDYCGSLGFNKNGSFSGKQTDGNYAYKNMDRRHVNYPSCSIDDIVSLIDNRYIDINRKFQDKYHNSSCYLVMRISIENYNKVKDKISDAKKFKMDDFLNTLAAMDMMKGSEVSNAINSIASMDEDLYTALGESDSGYNDDEENNILKQLANIETSIVENKVSEERKHYITICTEVDRDYSLYSEGYMHIKAISNYYFTKLIKDNVIQTLYEPDGLCLLDPNLRKYKFIYTDIDLPHKLNRISRELSTSFRKYAYMYKEDWKNLALDAINGKSPITNNVINHKIPLVIESDIFKFESKAEGIEIDRVDMLDMIDIDMFVKP
nr:MAG: RNA-dependent RNA polymerase [Drosophila Sunshine bunyavirus]